MGRGVGRAWARVRVLEGRACAPLSCAVGTPTAVRELSVWVGGRARLGGGARGRRAERVLAKSPGEKRRKTCFAASLQS